MSRTILFQARRDGYLHQHVPGIVRTARGVVVVSVEARYAQRGGREERNPDYRDHDILIRRSVDEGQAWLPTQVVLSHRDFGPGPLHNFTMIAERTGRLHALVLHDYVRLFQITSDDDGATWSTPIDRTDVLLAIRAEYPWKAVGTGCGHGIQLRSGRLLVPVWMSDNTHSSHRPSDLYTLYSDDSGATWRWGEAVCRTTDQYRWPSEAMAAELADGSVVINFRNESDERRRLMSRSSDGISRWSTPRFVPELVEPVCEGAMISVPDPRDPSRSLLAFTNPASLERNFCSPTGRKSDRKNLTLRLSFDDGQTWPVAHVIEPGPANYSDLCVLADGALLIVFNGGMADKDMHDSAYTCVERIDLRPLLT